VATFHQPPELLDELLDPRVVADLDLATVVSPTQAEWFRGILPDDRVEVVLYGVDADFFTPAPRRTDDEPGARLRCVTVGHWLRDWNALRAVVERLTSDRGVEFHVVTSRETGLGGLPNVVLHRNVSDDELRAIYRSADVAVLPLTGATANNALLEAIACGLPVVSTALPSVRAYVPNGEALLVEGNDADGLTAAILALRADPEARREMGRHARARAEVLSWHRISRRFMSIYERWRT
jgi:glycosyltransferase involved in cell wall biosynthesis